MFELNFLLFFSQGKWGTYRHLTLRSNVAEQPTKEHCVVNYKTVGDLSTLTWSDGDLKYALPEGEVVNIQYAALNFRDCMLATGRISKDSISLNTESITRVDLEFILGLEFAGVTDCGRRVMGLAKSGALATKFVPNPAFVFDVPDKWTLAEAATVPLVYFTVYYAFFETVKIQKGKSVLIHAGSGGIGNLFNLISSLRSFLFKN